MNSSMFITLRRLQFTRAQIGQSFKKRFTTASNTPLSSWEMAVKQIQEKWPLIVLGGSISTVGFFIKYEISRIDSNIGETNQRIDQTNQRIDQTNQRIDQVRKDLSDDIKDTNKRIDEVRKDLSDDIKNTNKRIDEVRKELSDDIKDTNKKIDKLSDKIDQLKDIIIQQNQPKNSSWFWSRK